MDIRFPADIDLAPELLHPLATAIGGVVLAWGAAESSLNMSVAIVFQMAGGRHLADEIPVAMGRKLKFMRRCLNRIAILEPFKDDGLAVMKLAGELAYKRNGIVHGFLSGVDRETKTFTFTGLGSERDVPLIKGQPSYTLQELIDLGVACMALATQMATFMQRLGKTFTA